MKVYINYPVPHFTIHWDPDCPRIRQHKRERQRILHVSASNVDQLLADFRQGKHPFKAEPYYNDMWLEVNLATPTAEREFVQELRSAIGGRYRPLATAQIREHCERW